LDADRTQGRIQHHRREFSAEFTVMNDIAFGVFDHIDRSGLRPPEFFEARLKLIETYDRAGFYAYHCAEHHLAPIGMVASPSVFLAAVAQRTKQLRFGPLVYVLPLYHTLRLIEEICLLDQMSSGRLELGFGRGSSAAEVQYSGESPDRAEAIYNTSLTQIIDALTSNEYSVPGLGETFQHMPLSLQSYQRPHPPIWYGVHSVESAERAAKRGLGMISLDDSALTRTFNDRYRATWREANGDQPMRRLGISRFVFVSENGDEALAIARRAYARWFENFTYTARRHRYTITHARPADFDTMVAQGRAVAGTPDAVSAFVRTELETAGANYFVGQFAFGDLTPEEAQSSVALFARDVMPAFTAVATA
jgi:alkanesulfonate monooxygenase SsuD/methylene tetrahydromethanopterin reductase-like flavin-dependent oxidoreductase (luciferase family)